MNYKEAVEWVHNLPRMPKENGLWRMEALLEELDNPQKKLKFLHFAGTNGKGSAVILCASVLKEAGYKVGTNISPYVVDFRERFQINGEMITELELAEVLSSVRMAAVKMNVPILEFEAVTAAAFLYFAHNQCDIVCLEVGIGGRLDSTNVITNTLVACIMRIGMDHTAMLGETIQEIAAEKCGIIKENCVVVSYPMQLMEAMQEIKKQANEKKSLLVVPDLKSLQYLQKGFFEDEIAYKDLNIILPFAGWHQVYNATVVIETMLVLRSLGYNIPNSAIKNGIEKAKFAARIEIVSRNPLIIIDGAHNEDSALALVETLEGEKLDKLTVIFGALKDKNVEKIIGLIDKIADKIILVKVDNPRSMEFEQLKEIMRKYKNKCEIQPTVEKALLSAKNISNKGILVCGSLYLASEARHLILQ